MGNNRGTGRDRSRNKISFPSAPGGTCWQQDPPRLEISRPPSAQQQAPPSDRIHVRPQTKRAVTVRQQQQAAREQHRTQIKTSAEEQPRSHARVSTPCEKDKIPRPSYKPGNSNSNKHSKKPPTRRAAEQLATKSPQTFLARRANLESEKPDKQTHLLQQQFETPNASPAIMSSRRLEDHNCLLARRWHGN